MEREQMIEALAEKTARLYADQKPETQALPWSEWPADVVGYWRMNAVRTLKALEAAGYEVRKVTDGA